RRLEDMPKDPQRMNAQASSPETFKGAIAGRPADYHDVRRALRVPGEIVDVENGGERGPRWTDGVRSELLQTGAHPRLSGDGGGGEKPCVCGQKGRHYAGDPGCAFRIAG